MVLQSIANAITTNNPECHLMVVLVDERPEEVTDMQRSVKGEVIASTFDRPADDHTTIAELAIERAQSDSLKWGHDARSSSRLHHSFALAPTTLQHLHQAASFLVVLIQQRYIHQRSSLVLL
jgi:hypothetical protein